MLTRDLHRVTVLADISTWLQNHDALLPSGDEILTDETSRAPFCSIHSEKTMRYINSK
jgi:hypothetical protein